MNHASLESIIEKQKKRYQVLKWMYEMVGDDSKQPIRPATFYETGRTTQDEIYRVMDYLIAEGLVNRVLGDITISHKGIKEIEDSIVNPKQRTEHFLATVIQHFYNVQGGVQVNGEGNSQTVSIISGENNGTE